MTDHDVFSKFYRSVNLEWPQFGMTDEEAQEQERRWRFVLGTFPTDALAHAMKQALRLAKKRPRAADFFEWASEAVPKRAGAGERTLPHWTLCECGCGGKRWYLVLRETAGAIRYHAATVEEMTDKLSGRLASSPALVAEYVQMCGQPMLRSRVACLRQGGDPMPDTAYFVGLENGVPVYDPNRMAVALLAAPDTHPLNGDGR